MSMLCYDPGTTKGHAWAYFSVGILGAVGRDEPSGVCVELVLIEKPRWHEKARSPAIVNDLIDLSIAVGRLAENHERNGAAVELVRASAWKGQVPKPVMCQRTYDNLTPTERALLPLKRGRKASRSARDHDDNILDAVGLGLWKLGRLN